MRAQPMTVKRTTEQQRLLIGVVAFTALALYVYVLYVLRPLMGSVVRLSREVHEVSRQVQQMEQVVAQATNVQHDYTELQDRVAQLRGRLPSEDQLPAVLEWLSAVASETGVRILSIFPQRSSQPFKPAMPASPELYKSVAIEIDALSGFHQLGMFLSRVESGDRAVEVKQLQISQSERELRRHKVKLILLTYVTLADAHT
ncbi:MAG: type 4a pilus biogenesis protein PilO [Candidatus Omnitrophica bacterium]|nr:type 4a pilus biogenesis protein PilO [Candidatus Omnitrophota bacterium]